MSPETAMTKIAEFALQSATRTSGEVGPLLRCDSTVSSATTGGRSTGSSSMEATTTTTAHACCRTPTSAPDAAPSSATACCDDPSGIESNVNDLPSNYRPSASPSLAPPPQAGARKGYNLFVGTLPNGSTQESLEILFSPFGQLLDTYLLKQEGKGRYRCGFVSYAEYYSAAHAIARLNSFRPHEGCSPICVRFANPPKPASDEAGASNTPPLARSPSNVPQPITIGFPGTAAPAAAASAAAAAAASMAHHDYTMMLLQAAAGDTPASGAVAAPAPAMAAAAAAAAAPLVNAEGGSAPSQSSSVGPSPGFSPLSTPTGGDVQRTQKHNEQIQRFLRQQQQQIGN